MYLAEEANRILSVIKKKESKEAYQCPNCKDLGYIYYTDKNNYDMRKDCDCLARRMAIRRMEKSGIMEEDRNKTLDDVKTFGEKELQSAKNIVEDYMNRFKEFEATRSNSLLLMGQSGSGKTMLGIIAAMHIINEYGIGLKYVSYREMITQLKQIVMDEYEYNNELYKLFNAPVLFIDDLFKGKITGSDINIVYSIINARYLKRKPIIVSTELDVDKMLEIDEAIASRIIEMSTGHVVLFSNTANYRMRGIS